MKLALKLALAAAVLTSLQGCVAYTVASTAVGTTAKVGGAVVGVGADAVGAASDAVFVREPTTED